MKRNQYTLGKPISFKGNGLHSGIPVTITMRPAPAGSGIIFRRIDLTGAPEVPAKSEFVTNTLRATTLERGNAKVFTVEHILSALFALRIDNCILEMDAPEPPVADGGALTFSQMILGTQMKDFTIDKETYIREIAPSRTIGFTWELEAMRQMGLGKGGTLENAVVYSETDCLSELKFPDELVRHKILDILGDISLVGPLHAHIIAVMGSHKLNAALAAKLRVLKK